MTGVSPSQVFSPVVEQEQLALVLSRYVDALDAGHAPDRERLLAEYPELAGELSGCLEGLDWLQRALHGMKEDPGRPAAIPPFPEGQLGDYRLVREIGRGGMGVVYEARQLSLGRTVALKLLPFSGLLDPKQIARFRNEAQAAASLQHPGIVPVYAVGCENGVHYYSMQYIDGQPLDRVITQLSGGPDPRDEFDPARCSIPERVPSHIWDVPSTIDVQHPRPVRDSGPTKVTGEMNSTVQSLRTRNYVRNVVELMVQAADALQHAHECGVIHRDIKPSNLIVDRQGKLWITDFGLARSTFGPDLTVTGALLGTVRYMSPEQAAGQTQLVDSRTDIYSLGISLFEVLTLRPAYGGTDHHALLKQIQEEPPPALRRLNPAIPFDLETIVLKAIAKSRDDRYPTAKELAEDLRRFLAGEPTQARRPTLRDRTCKWVGRHRALAGGAFLAMTLSLLGVSLAAGLLVAEQRKTDAALHRTRQHLRSLQGVLDRFGAGVSDELREVEGAEPIRGKLLRETLAGYQTLLTYAAEDPSLAEDAAKAAFKAAAVQEQLGGTDAAVTLYQQSRQRFSELVRKNPAAPELVADFALVDNNLGALWTRLGQLEPAVEALREAAARQQELQRRYPAEPRYRQDWALTQINLGLALADLGKRDSALHCYRAAVNQLRNATTSAEPESSPQQSQRLATALHNWSGLVADDDLVEAEGLARQAREILEQLAGPTARAELGLVLAHHATVLSRQGRTAEALPLFDEAVAIQRTLMQTAPDRVAHRVDLATIYNNRGQRLLEAGNWPAAEQDLQAAREMFLALMEEFPEVPLHAVGLATVLSNLARGWERSAQLEEAAAAWTEAVRVQQDACRLAPRTEQFGMLLEKHRRDLARVLTALGRQTERKRSA